MKRWIEIKEKLCKSHNIAYQYVCPKCLLPHLKGTGFSNLSEIRKYQTENSKNLRLFDGFEDINLVGVLKVKIINDLAYSAILFYNINEQKITNTHFKSTKPIFPNYFSSVLFLNYTSIYLDLLNDLEEKLDCYVINSSGQIHPFYYGAACDLGLKINLPVIGYTEKLLFGELRKPQNDILHFEVFHGDRLLGYAIPKLKSKKFYYISVGNNISLNSAKRTFLKLDLTIISKVKKKLNEYITLNKKTMC